MLYKITIKEKCRNKPLETRYDGNVDERYLIEFYGLEKPDVEWYKIEKLI